MRRVLNFKVVTEESINLSVVTQNSFSIRITTVNASPYTIDFGDGTVESYPSGVQSNTHTYGSSYTGDITITVDKLQYITAFISYNNSFNFNLIELTVLTGLTYYLNMGNNTTSGDIANLPSGLNYYINAGRNTTSGDIANLPSGLIYYRNQGSNTTSGDIANLPSGLTFYYNAGNNEVGVYTQGRNWGVKLDIFINTPSASIYKLSSNEVDSILIDMASTITTSVGSKLIELRLHNPRTSLSNIAVSYLQSIGFTVNTT